MRIVPEASSAVGRQDADTDTVNLSHGGHEFGRHPFQVFRRTAGKAAHFLRGMCLRYFCALVAFGLKVWKRHWSVSLESVGQVAEAQCEWWADDDAHAEVDNGIMGEMLDEVNGHGRYPSITISIRSDRVSAAGSRSRQPR